MKLAISQINTTVGDIAGNGKKVISAIKKARNLGADLVCFHEMTLLGYPPRDLLELPHLLSRCMQEIEKVAKESRGIAVLVGGIFPNRDQPGKPLWNAAFWCEEGRVRHVFKKTLLPSYDVFDETRYFEPGQAGDIVDFRGLKIGVTICEDIWNESENGLSVYSANPVGEWARKGAGFLINLSASPYSLDKWERRRKLFETITRRHQVSLLYVNQVGGNDELIFDGGSTLVGPDGLPVFQAPFFREGLWVVDTESVGTSSEKVPVELELLEEALVMGLRDYVRKCGFKKAALGLSGGIDSALVCALAAKALGPQNVVGLLMPSRYSSSGSINDSKKLAKNLKVSVQIVPIHSIHKAYEAHFGKMFGKRKKDTTEENIQARIRGNLLMALSNKLGYLLLSTGNKSELAVGYCTLYGDMSGGLAVISDLPKTLVYRLAHHINRKKEIIPEPILTKPPSAELKPNQTDQDTLPSYEVLDAIMKAAVEEMKSEEEIVQNGFPKAIVRKVLKMIQTNEYKRRQAAPGLRVTSKAFGMGRRFPIACKM